MRWLRGREKENGIKKQKGRAGTLQRKKNMFSISEIMLRGGNSTESCLRGREVNETLRVEIRIYVAYTGNGWKICIMLSYMKSVCWVGLCVWLKVHSNKYNTDCLYFIQYFKWSLSLLHQRQMYPLSDSAGGFSGTLYHLKLRGTDQWEVREADHRCWSERRKKDGNLIKM